MADPTATARTNVLHDYANYAYNLQLWVINRSDFNKISQGAIVIGKEQDIVANGQLLISDGGANATDKRSTAFPTDMIIDNLQIETLVGNKGPNRGTDAISLKFDIIEPYTVTLLDRLITLATGPYGFNQDFKTLIYCFRIQFFGYDDQGKPVTIPNTTKWIPFTMLNMQFSVTHKGAVYNCDGLPMQNMALTVLDNVIPFHVELKGQTVKDLFSDGTSSGVFKSRTDAGTAARTDTASAPNNTNTTIINGIAKALNDNEAYKVSLKSQTFANVYKFEFEDVLANAIVQDPTKLPDNSVAMAPVKGAAGKQSQQQSVTGALQLDKTTGTYRSATGTRITDLIQTIMINTDFMKNQVAATGAAPDSSKPFIGIKVIPKMELGNYDSKTNFFQRTVTYVVKTYEYYGEDHPELSQKPYDPAAVVKNYEYLFTGNNRDVIKVNLDYKIAFFDVRNGTKNNTTDQAGDASGDKETTQAQGTGALPNKNVHRAITPQVNGLQNMDNSGGTSTDKRSLTLAEMVSKLFDNGVDLISLDIDIVGDPDWIMQDNILYGPNVAKNKKTLSNGTINFQDSITCFKFTFKSPTTDYSDTTGLFDVSKANTASFSGIYQVLSVTSKFMKGRFSQTLANVRLRTQASSSVTNQRATTP
jgi:hypothetical protein